MKPITIIGGGLAGLTLGIGLRQRAVPVTLWEAGHYPRHRVCGEFISGRGQQTLAHLGLRDLLDHAGAVTAATATFSSPHKSTAIRPLPEPAVCLSRFDLDAGLAKKFRELGGELLENQRHRNDETGDGVVYATGRQLQTDKNGARWFGLKAHAHKVSLMADLEMHVSPRGYVGLCRLKDGVVNVCGLFRRHAGESDPPQDRLELLRGPTGSLLHQRLETAEFDEDSICAVAGLSMQPQRAVAHNECRVGDAITMIPPITGNGMSMAFESAELAIAPLTAWSLGEISWTGARRQVACGCDTAFAGRLAWAGWLQRLIIAPSLQNALVTLASRSDRFWRLAFEKTR